MYMLVSLLLLVYVLLTFAKAAEAPGKAMIITIIIISCIIINAIIIISSIIMRFLIMTSIVVSSSN